MHIHRHGAVVVVAKGRVGTFPDFPSGDLTTIESKGFKPAAEQLHKTPAAISQQLKRLEETIGHRVLERSNQGISLTSAGAVRLRPHYLNNAAIRFTSIINDQSTLIKIYLKSSFNQFYLSESLLHTDHS